MENNISPNGMSLRRARKTEAQEVLSLYGSVIGAAGCVWDEYYPGSETIARDLENGCLYVYTDKNGVIIGAVSVDLPRELDDIAAWRVCDGTQCEIARVVIAPESQGHGYAAAMLSNLFGILAAGGCHAVHLLVSKSNPAAIKTYRRLGFDILGECHMYDADFYICEKPMGTAVGSLTESSEKQGAFDEKHSEQ